MEKILSQEEVNALLKGIDSGDVSTDASSADDNGCRKYDLTSHERVIRGRMPTLEIISERFTRIFQVSMSAMLKKMVDVNMVSVHKIRFSKFIAPLQSQIFANPSMNSPLKGFSLL